MSSGIIALRAGGVAVVLDARGPGLPRVLHWGADPGEGAARRGAGAAAGAGRARRAGAALARARARRRAPRAAGADGLGVLAARSGWRRVEGTAFTARDEDAGLALRSELELGETGVLRLRHTLRNEGPEPYRLDELGCVLPLPPVATELLDLTGRWCRERAPQRRELGLGTWLRETRHGRTGHDAPLLTVAGTPGFGFRSGEVWGIHLGWSGDAAVWAERLPAGPGVLGAGGAARAGRGRAGGGGGVRDAVALRGLVGPRARRAERRAARLAAGAAGASREPAAGGAEHVGGGLLRPRAGAPDRAGGHRGGARRRALRARRRLVPRPPRRRRRARRLVRRRGRLAGRAGAADRARARARDGVRAVGGARDGQRRLRPLPRASRLGARRAGPAAAGVAAPAGARPRATRTASPTCSSASTRCWASTTSRSSSGTTTATSSSARVHAQTLAVYRLLDELRARHPGVEIESCASGGGRVDLGILERTDRVWASDTNDALERQAIQRWTGLLLAPELVGAHVGPPRAHTTGRTHDLSFRVATALFGHFGFEWDVSAASAEEQAGIARRSRSTSGCGSLLHGGEVVRADHHDPAAWVHGVVAGDACRLRLRAAHVGRDRGARRGAVARPGSGADVPRRAGAPGGRAADAARDAAAVAGGGRDDAERARAGDGRPADAGARAGASAPARVSTRGQTPG